MLRRLIWLKSVLWWRALGAGGRRTVVLVLIVLPLFTSPLWIGGSVATYVAVMRYGAPAFACAVTAVQMIWLAMSLALGALGQPFDMRRLLYYPIEPRAIYGVGILLTFVDPIALLFLPPMVAAVAAAAMHSGLLVGVVAALSVVAALLVTAAFQQLLLAVLNDLLRRGWVRHLASALFSLAFAVPSLAFSRMQHRLMEPLLAGDAGIVRAIFDAARSIRWLPIAGWQAAIGAGALAGNLLEVFAGLAGSIALLALLFAFGERVTLATALAPELIATSRPRRARSEGRRTWALPDWLASRTFAPLLAREVRYVARTPQIISSLLVTPLLLFMFYMLGSRTLWGSPWFAFFMVSNTALTWTRSLFGFDRQGVRAFYLMPIDAVELLVAKNVTLLGLLLVDLALVLVALLVAGLRWDAFQLLAWLLALLAQLGCYFNLGNWLSVHYPVRMLSRFGMRGGSSGGFAPVLMQIGAALATSSTLLVLWFGVRWLAPPPSRELAGLLTLVVACAASWGWWAMRLEACAEEFTGNRERLIEALAVADENG